MECDAVKKWRDRSLWFWIALVAGVYVLFLIAVMVINVMFPAPHWGDFAVHRCITEDSLIVYYVCDGFTGAKVVEFVRNLPTLSWAIPAFAIFGSPFLLLFVALFAALIVAFAWGLRATVRVIGRRKQTLRASR